MFSICASKPTAKLRFEGAETPDFDESLVAAFERVAATFPSRTAIGSDVWEPTYRELNNTANRYIRQAGESGLRHVSEFVQYVRRRVGLNAGLEHS